MTLHKAGESRTKTVETLVWMALLASLMTLLELAKWIPRAGVFSLVSAVSAVRAEATVVVLDMHGLLYPMIALLAVAVLGLLRLLDLGQSPRTTGAIVAICAIGGGFILNEACAKPALTGFLTAHRYVRCQTGDYSVGRIWFDSYVLPPEPCVARAAHL